MRTASDRAETNGDAPECGIERGCSVSALFVRQDSIYKTMPGVDCWDADRDARLYAGPWPIVAHPPCRLWGKLAPFATRARPDEKELAHFAVECVRKFGGVLEHPSASRLWPAANLPALGARDEFGGFTVALPQNWFGHRAEKATRLYVCGCEPKDLPAVPLTLAEPTHVVSSGYKAALGKIPDGSRSHRSNKPEISKAERERTPPAFAEWLIELARRCAKTARPLPDAP